tara:strand:+ start:949 stop:3873 length:2925 start_codon:yes stop_codon:yes gene_type:complete
MTLIKFLFFCILLVFYSNKAVLAEEERIFNFQKSSCSGEENYNKVFNTNGSELVFIFKNIIDNSNSKKYPVKFTKNKFKGKVDGYGKIELKGRNGKLDGRYNEAMDARKILLKFSSSKKKYSNLNNCTLLFEGNYGSKNFTNAQKEKIIKTLSTRLAKKIQKTTKGELTEINIWVLNILMSLNFEESLEKQTKRSETQRQILELGIEKFSNEDQNLLEKELAAKKEKEKKEARLKAEEEAKLKAEEEARLKAEEEARLKAEEEARLKAEEEARLKAEEEARLKAEEEARLKAEEEARLKAKEEARLKAEEEARLKAEEEKARLKAEEEARLKAAAAEEKRKQDAIKFTKEKNLAQIYINDLIDFIKIYPNEFDIIDISNLIIATKSIIDEDFWNEDLKIEYKELVEFVSKSNLFNNFHFTNNEKREKILLDEIESKNNKITEIAKYFRFYLQNNITSPFAPEVIEKIKIAEKTISSSNLEEKNTTIEKLLLFIESKKLNKDFNSFLKTLISSDKEVIKHTENKKEINQNKLLTIDFIENTAQKDLISIVNLSGKAPNAIINLSGEIVFENNEAVSCFYQNNIINKEKMFYFFDKIAERKFKIINTDGKCDQDNLLKYDLIFFVKNDILNESQDFVDPLINEIQSENFVKYKIILENKYIEDMKNRKLFAEQIKKDVLEGVRIGFGFVAIKNQNQTLCSDINNELDTHRSIINLLNNEFKRLGYSKEVKNNSFKDKEKTFIDVQREKCGFLYVDQDSLKLFLEGFERTKTEYEIIPVWYSQSQINKEKLRLEEISNNQMINEQKKKEEEEKKLKLEKERLKSEGTLKAAEQKKLRERNRNIVEAHIDLWEQELNKFFNSKNIINSEIYLQYRSFSDFMINKFNEGWQLDSFVIEPFDYGKGEYRKRQIDTFTTIINFKLKNNDIGDYESYCVNLTIMDDKEFNKYREPFLNECSDNNLLKNYQIKHSFTSEWVVN